MTPSQKPRWSVKKALYTQEASNKGTAEGSQSRGSQKNGLKNLPMKTGPFLDTDDSYDYWMDLLDRFVQVREPDEELINEMFQAFRTIVAIGIGDVVFVRRCYKWPFEQIRGGGGY